MTRFKAVALAGALMCASAPGAHAQFGGANSLAPQDGLPLELPSLPPDVRRGLAPVSPGSLTKTVLSLSALFFTDSPPIDSGLRWRIFADQADVNGNYPLVLESTDAKPFVTLDPGGYIVHVAYGLAAETQHVVIGTESVPLQITLDVGALRFKGMIGEKQIPADELEFEIHRADGTDEELVARVKSGVLLRLKAGLYQITSTYGQANAKIVSEIRVEPGKLTEANVLHKAGRIDLRLLATNGNAITDAVWSILTPGGDIVSENLPSPDDVILAEGEYVAVARYEGRIFQKPFDVQSGRAANVDVAAVN